MMSLISIAASEFLVSDWVRAPQRSAGLRTGVV